MTHEQIYFSIQPQVIELFKNDSLKTETRQNIKTIYESFLKLSNNGDTRQIQFLDLAASILTVYHVIGDEDNSLQKKYGDIAVGLLEELSKKTTQSLYVSQLQKSMTISDIIKYIGGQ